MTICKKYANQVYWSSLDASTSTSKTKADYCKEKNLLAFADYSKGNDLYFSQEDKTMKATSTSTKVITKV